MKLELVTSITLTKGDQFQDLQELWQLPGDAILREINLKGHSVELVYQTPEV